MQFPVSEWAVNLQPKPTARTCRASKRLANTSY